MPHDAEPIADALEPGQFVVLPSAPDWGLGQVQSVVGHKVTVNFENAGKRTINLKHATLARAHPSGESKA